jgi:cytochrome P450
MTTQQTEEPQPRPGDAAIDDFTQRFSRYASYKTTPAEAFALFEEARTKCPVPHSDESDGFYVLVNYDDVKAAHSDWHTFSNEPGIMRPIGERPQLPPLEYDPPAHDEWRRVFKEALNPHTPARIEDAVRADIAECIEEFAGRGTCDLVHDFAEPIPLRAICHVLGVEKDKTPTFRSLAQRFIATFGDKEEFPKLLADFFAFGVGEVMERREHPRDDYLTWLSHATMNGKLMEPVEIGTTMVGLLTAGHDTAVIGLTMTLFEVLKRPHIKAQLLENPDLIPAAVDEGLRLHPPFIGFFRRATRDVTVAGIEIPEGASLQLCWAAANRDPTVFEDPEEFRLDRKPGTKRHLTFGYGIHSCVGQPTARMEIRLALEELLKRLPDIELENPDDAEYLFVGPENATIATLPARFTPS